MSTEFIQLYPHNVDLRKVRHITESLRKGAIIIYPTDTVYGIGCDLHSPKAIEKLCRIKGEKFSKINLSFICCDLSHLSEYARGVSTPVFRLLKRTLPGPYTFILEASSKVPKILDIRKKTVGIRVPDNDIIRTIVRELGNPVVSSSVKQDDDVAEYPTDPNEIYGMYDGVVDIVIDGGFGYNTPSTVIDCTEEPFKLVRAGPGASDIISAE